LVCKFETRSTKLTLLLRVAGAVVEGIAESETRLALSTRAEAIDHKPVEVHGAGERRSSGSKIQAAIDQRSGRMKGVRSATSFTFGSLWSI